MSGRAFKRFSDCILREKSRGTFQQTVVRNGSSSRNQNQHDFQFTWTVFLEKLRNFPWKIRTSDTAVRRASIFTRLQSFMRTPSLSAVEEGTLQRLTGQSTQHCRARKTHFLLAACLFSLQKEHAVSGDELDQAVDDLEHIMSLHSTASEPEVDKTNAEARIHDHYLDDWTLIFEKPGIAIWSRPVPGKSYYEYKVHGSYKDIPARAFYFVQVDLAYRKQWDENTDELQVVDTDKSTGTEVVHWICHFPRPMYKREYLYSRRYAVNREKNCLVIVNRAINHPKFPISRKYVRVEDYSSRMVIKPHKSFDENGFDYTMTYYDDTKTSMPNSAYNYMVGKNLPDFLNRLYLVAKDLVNVEGKAKYLLDESAQTAM